MISLGGGQQAGALGNCSGGDAGLDGEEQAFLGLINNYRGQRGLSTLSISGGLNRSSAWMVNDMATTGRFGHTDSLGRNPWTRLSDCGNPSYGGENLAAGTERGSASSAFELLRNSPSHNAVMLSPEFRLIGIARQFSAGSTYGWYWTTDFGNGDGSEAAPVATAVPAPPPPPAAPAPVVAAPPPAKPQTVVSAPAPSVAAQVVVVAPPPVAEAEPDPESEAASPLPVAWEGDDQLAAAILGSVAFELGETLVERPTFNEPVRPSGA